MDTLPSRSIAVEPEADAAAAAPETGISPGGHAALVRYSVGNAQAYELLKDLAVYLARLEEADGITEAHVRAAARVVTGNALSGVDDDALAAAAGPARVTMVQRMHAGLVHAGTAMRRLRPALLQVSLPSRFPQILPAKGLSVPAAAVAVAGLVAAGGWLAFGSAGSTPSMPHASLPSMATGTNRELASVQPSVLPDAAAPAPAPIAQAASAGPPQDIPPPVLVQPAAPASAPAAGPVLAAVVAPVVDPVIAPVIAPLIAPVIAQAAPLVPATLPPLRQPNLPALPERLVTAHPVEAAIPAAAAVSRRHAAAHAPRRPEHQVATRGTAWAGAEPPQDDYAAEPPGRGRYRMQAALRPYQDAWPTAPGPGGEYGPGPRAYRQHYIGSYVMGPNGVRIFVPDR